MAGYSVLKGRTFSGLRDAPGFKMPAPNTRALTKAEGAALQDSAKALALTYSQVIRPDRVARQDYLPLPAVEEAIKSGKPPWMDTGEYLHRIRELVPKPVADLAAKQAWVSAVRESSSKEPKDAWIAAARRGGAPKTKIDAAEAHEAWLKQQGRLLGAAGAVGAAGALVPDTSDAAGYAALGTAKRRQDYLQDPQAAVQAILREQRLARPTLDDLAPAPGYAQAAPRGGLLGAVADALGAVKGGLNAPGRVPEQVPLVGGLGLGDLALGESPALLDDMSYGMPLSGRQSALDPRVFDLVMLGAASPSVGAAVKRAGLEAITPVPPSLTQAGAFNPKPNAWLHGRALSSDEAGAMLRGEWLSPLPVPLAPRTQKPAVPPAQATESFTPPGTQGHFLNGQRVSNDELLRAIQAGNPGDPWSWQIKSAAEQAEQLSELELRKRWREAGWKGN